MPFADVNGQRLFYEDVGTGAPAIVFSHGIFMDRAMFEPQLAAFGGRYRCVAWDQRAHGQTDSGPEPFTYWDSGDDLIGLLDHLGVERAILAGNSQGGFLQLRAALRHPDRVLALILLNTQAGTEDAERVPMYEQLIARWTDPEEGVPQEIADVVAHIILGDYARAGDWQAKWRETDHARVRQAYDTLVGREDIHDRLGNIEAPALVIHAADDLAIEPAKAERLAEGLPQGEFVLVDSGGHSANLANPDEVNVHIERFLARVTESAGA